MLLAVASGGTLLDAAKAEEVSYRNAWDRLMRDYREEYQRAKICGTEALVEKALKRAEESTSETAAGDRTFTDFVKWLSARRSPGDYGDKQTVISEGKGNLHITGDILVQRQEEAEDIIVIPAEESEPKKLDE